MADTGFTRRLARGVSRAAKDRARPALRSVALRTLERFSEGSVLTTEYPIASSSRYGWDERPAHGRIEEVLAQGRDDHHRTLESFEARLPELRAIGRRPSGRVPGWDNDWFAGLDAVALYGFIAQRRPERYVEVGSGHSTAFTRRAIDDHGLSTHVTSIDPAPRADIDELCDDVRRCGLEAVGAGPFAELVAGDVVLIDGSHNCFMGNDVAVTFLEVLPAIPKGVLVGIDDVFLPWDYPPDWVGRWYAEQYLLATLLLTEDPGWRVVLPDFWLSRDPASAASIERFADPARSSKFGLGGVTFWMEKT